MFGWNWIVAVLLLSVLLNGDHSRAASTPQPTGEPSTQPSAPPSAQPSSVPTQATTDGVFTVPVTDHGDAAFDYRTQVNPCSAAHWPAQPSTTCTLRAALAFCVHNVPWNSNATDVHSAHPRLCTIRLARAIYGDDILLRAGAIELPPRAAPANMTVQVEGDGVTLKAGTSGTGAFDFHRRRQGSLEQASNYGLHMRLADLTFRGFRAAAPQAGGAVHVTGLASLEIEATQFEDNQGGLGGALHVSNCSLVTLSNLRFDKNRAVSGGALFSRWVHTLQLRDSHFLDGVADTVGGAVAVEACHSVSVLRCVLQSNQADQHGGALAAHDVREVLLRGLAVRDNSAAYGPAACLRQARNVVFDNNTIASNTAAVGAAVYWIRDGHLAASMPPPVVHANNAFSSNHYGASQPDHHNISTEVLKLTTVPAAHHLVDYVNEDPLQMQVSLLDFYGHSIPLEVAVLDLLVRPANADGCSYNKERAAITGSASTTTLNANAFFDGFGVRCIPGGHMNISVVPSFSAAATNFPLYELPGDAQKAAFDAQRRSFETLVPVSLRACRVGEYFDFDNSYGRDACRVCRSGYSLRDNSANEVIRCESCPANSVDCYSDTVVLNPGTWRHAKSSKKVFFCPKPEGCLGGEGYGQEACQVGYRGVLCSSCDEHYSVTADRQACESCGVRTPSEQLVIPFALLALALLALLIYYCIRLHHHHLLMHQVHPLKKPSHETILEMQQHMIKQERWFEKLIEFSPRIKIVITSYQVIALLPENLRMQRVGALIGSKFDHFVRFIAWVNVDTLRAMPISCYRAWTYIDSMKAVASIPIMVSLSLVCTYGIYIRYYHYHYKPSHMYPQDNLQAYFKQIPVVSDIVEQNFEEEVRLIRQSLFSRYVFVAVIISYFSVPAVMLSVLDIFDCVDLDPNREDPAPFPAGLDSSSAYLRADMSVNCASSQYIEGKKFVIAACVIYPIAFPALYYWLYHRAQKFSEMVRDGHADVKMISAPIRFLFSESYKPGFYSWEFVDIAKRFLLIVGLAYINNGTQLQIVWGMMITLLLLKLQCHYQPYVRRRDNVWAELGYAQIFCTLLGFLVYRSRALDTNPELYPALDFFMVAVNGLFVLLIAWDMNGFWLTKLVGKLLACLCHVLITLTRDKSHDHDRAKSAKIGQDTAGQKKLEDEKLAAQKCHQDATETATRFLKEEHAEYVQSLVQDVIATAMFQPSFRKSRPQQKHLRKKGVRQKELAFMRSNFKELLRMLQTPNNALVDVLDAADPLVTVDDINRHKLHLEDSLTAAENILAQQRESRAQLLVERGLPYDALGNLGDIDRVERSDKRYFHTDVWLPPAFALNDNRMYRTCMRPAEKVRRDESSEYIAFSEVDAVRALVALATAEDLSDSSYGDDDDGDGDDSNGSVGWEEAFVGALAGGDTPDGADRLAIEALSPIGLSVSHPPQQEDSELDSSLSSRPAARAHEARHHRDSMYALSSGDEDTGTDDGYDVAIRMPTTTLGRDAFELSDSSDEGSSDEGSSEEGSSRSSSGSRSGSGSASGSSMSADSSDDSSLEPVRI